MLVLPLHASRFPPAFLELQSCRARLDDGSNGGVEARLSSRRPQAFVGRDGLRRMCRRAGAAEFGRDAMVARTCGSPRVHQGRGGLGGLALAGTIGTARNVLEKS